MKKYLALFLALILSISTLSGCIPQTAAPTETKPALSSDDQKIVEKLIGILNDAEDLQKEIVDLTDDQISSAEKYDKQIEDAQSTGGELDPQKLIKDIGKNQKDLQDFVKDVESLNARIEKLKKPDSSQTVDCVSATSDYIGMLSSCLQDLDAVMQFYLDQDRAMRPIKDAESSEDDSDYLAVIENLYDAVDETVTNMNEIETCPDYMKESFAIYIRKISIYQNMLDSLYLGYYFGDPLRLSSSMQLFDRSIIEESKYSIEIFHLVKLQFEKVSDRLSDTISNLHDEIETACKSLDKAKEKLPKVSFSYQKNDPDIIVSFEAVDKIFPVCITPWIPSSILRHLRIMEM